MRPTTSSRILLVSIVAMLVGCSPDSDEMQRQLTELQTVRDSLSEDLASRDTYINDVTVAINDLHHSMEMMRSKERIVMKRTEETRLKQTTEEVRKNLFGQLDEVKATLQANWAKLEVVEAKLRTSEKHYAGLQDMVERMRETLKERETSIAELNRKVSDLGEQLAVKESRIQEQGGVISEQAAVIKDQTQRLNTGYYVVGQKGELEEKGIITDEGGFLWGLLGSTTVLASGIDRDKFYPIDRAQENTIEIRGEIEDIIPKRNPEYYTTIVHTPNHSVIKILDPERFWQDAYLVVVVD